MTSGHRGLATVGGAEEGMGEGRGGDVDRVIKLHTYIEFANRPRQQYTLHR